MIKVKRHIIRERDVGLFSLIQQVISHIPLALYNERYPIVYFGKNCCYWTSNGYEGKTNVWEYYFEPIINYAPINNLPLTIISHLNANLPFHLNSGYFLNSETFITNHFGDHKDFKNRSLNIPYKWKDPNKQVRIIANEIITKFINPRPYIRNKVDIFYSKFMQNHNFIGVHIRATDVSDLKTEYNIYRRYSYLPNQFVREIKKAIKLSPSVKIFIATDSHQTLNAMVNLFSDNIIYYSSIFQSSEPLSGKSVLGWKMPGYLTISKEKAAKNGEEAIIDYLLLSKCDYLIHNGSSLARTVLLNRPDIGHTNLHTLKNYLIHLLDPRNLEFYFLLRILIKKFIWRSTQLLKELFIRIF